VKLSPRDEIIVGVVAIVLVVAILFVALVRPQLAQLGKIGETRQEEEGRIKSAQAELGLLKAARSEALQVQADLIKVSNQVPDSPQVPSLVVEIQDLANVAGIKFVQIQPQPMTAAGDYTTLPLTLTLQGQFFDVVDFMYRLQHLTRELRVADLDLSAETQGTEGEASDNALTLKITANAFVMGSVPGALAPAGAPSTGESPGSPASK